MSELRATFTYYFLYLAKDLFINIILLTVDQESINGRSRTMPSRRGGISGV